MRSVIASAFVVGIAGSIGATANGDPPAPASAPTPQTAPASRAPGASPLDGLTPMPSSTTGISATPASGGTGDGTGAAPAPAPSTPELELPSTDETRAWDRFHLDFTGGAWFARVTGEVSADSPIKYDLADDLGLDSQEVSFAGDAEGRWRFLHFRLSGSSFRTSGGNSSTYANVFNGVVVQSGDPTASSLSMWNAGGDIGVDLWRPFADHPFPFGGFNEHNWRTNRVKGGGLGGDGGYRADLRLGAFVGARAFNTDLDFANLRSGQSTTLEQTWTAIYVGGRVTLDLWLRDHFALLERLSIDVDGSFGPAYPGSGTYFQVRAGVTMYPCDNFGVQFGYRLQKIHGDGGGQDLDANFAGLFVGGVLHF